MQGMAANAKTPSDSLLRRIIKVAPEFTELMNSLSTSVRPCSFVGFGTPKPAKNTALLLGWNYDWSDKGDPSPPWSDWPDKSE